MTRQRKQVVEYFPHYCDHKTTMFIIEQKYGNDGYAFWFKLLEILGKEEGHYLDLRNPLKQEYLQARTKLPENTVGEIIALLAKTGAIDKDLWKIKVIWSDNFVWGLKPVYANRRVEIPSKPTFLHVEIPVIRDTTGRKPQSRVEESRVEKGHSDLTITDDDKSSPCPHQEIIDLYHKTLPELAKIKVWTPKRQSHLRSRWNEDKQRQCIEWWELYFGRIKASPFLTGNITDFKADLEWVINQSNMVKIIEGKYDGERNGRSRFNPNGGDTRSQREREIDAETEKLNREYYARQKAKDPHDSSDKKT